MLGPFCTHYPSCFLSMFASQAHGQARPRLLSRASCFLLIMILSLVCVPNLRLVIMLIVLLHSYYCYYHSRSYYCDCWAPLGDDDFEFFRDLLLRTEANPSRKPYGAFRVWLTVGWTYRPRCVCVCKNVIIYVYIYIYIYVYIYIYIYL